MYPTGECELNIKKNASSRNRDEALNHPVEHIGVEPMTS